jgi:hypothetical protein
VPSAYRASTFAKVRKVDSDPGFPTRVFAATAERWQWLQQAMAFGFATARSRATQALMTLGPHGEVLWSPMHEVRWMQERPAGRGGNPSAGGGHRWA